MPLWHKKKGSKFCWNKQTRTWWDPSCSNWLCSHGAETERVRVGSPILFFEMEGKGKLLNKVSCWLWESTCWWVWWWWCWLFLQPFSWLAILSGTQGHHTTHFAQEQQIDSDLLKMPIILTFSPIHAFVLCLRHCCQRWCGPAGSILESNACRKWTWSACLSFKITLLATTNILKTAKRPPKMQHGHSLQLWCWNYEKTNGLVMAMANHRKLKWLATMLGNKLFCVCIMVDTFCLALALWDLQLCQWFFNNSSKWQFKAEKELKEHGCTIVLAIEQTRMHNDLANLSNEATGLMLHGSFRCLHMDGCRDRIQN